MSNSEARERVLRAAETLFTQRGYEAVTVKDIAKQAGIHHASIYHHLPEGGGKAALFVEVMTRHLHRHKDGIEQSIADAGDDFRAQLLGIAGWLISQPPMDMIRLTNSDIPALDTAGADELFDLAYFVLLVPITQVLEAAQARGEITHPNLGNIAGALVNVIEGMHTVPDEYVIESRLQMVEQVIDVFIRGLRPS